jgi:hypothetical protein
MRSHWVGHNRVAHHRIVRVAYICALIATVGLWAAASAPSAARADTLYGTAITNVFFGVNNIVTLDTNYSFYLEPGYALTSDVATAAGQSFAAQLAADPEALTGKASICINPGTGGVSTTCPQQQAIPAFVLNAISKSADGNILGLNAGVGTAISPDPARTAFDAMAGFNPSFVMVDPSYSFEYGFMTTLTSGPYAGDQISLLDNFEFYQATPIPAALPLFASGLAGLGLFSARRKRKAQAVTA